MLGTFIDTIIVCTITGLVIVTSGQWKVESSDYTACVERGGAIQREVSTAWGIDRTKQLCVEGEDSVNRLQTGATLTTAAFESELPAFGHYIVALGLVLFAFTTVLGWSVYGERCVEYLFGVGAILPFRMLWVLAIPVGATIKLSFAWLVADTLNALMAIPNLLALLLLSPVVFRITRGYFEGQKS
jgi:AGCS family alanine or glycine:cation symporter